MIALNLLIPILSIAAAVAGVVLTALKFRRDDATAVVNQHSTILQDMGRLSDEISKTLERCQERCAVVEGELDVLRVEHAQCPVRISALEGQVEQLQRQKGLLP